MEDIQEGISLRKGLVAPHIDFLIRLWKASKKEMTYEYIYEYIWHMIDINIRMQHADTVGYHDVTWGAGLNMV